jgi:hypothetical protein
MIFLNGNIDVITRILEFVAESSEDLNTCAMISQSFRLSRSDPRFDQTRTGTIIVKTALAAIHLKVWRRWNWQVFIGNRVRLVAIFKQLPGRYVYYEKFLNELPYALRSVREVFLRRDSSVKVPESLDECEHGGVAAVQFLKRLCRTSIF